MDAAAGAFAVISLAVQLADNIKKLSDFWKSVKDAPADVQNLITDLDLLSNVLREIDLEARQSEPNPTLENVLRRCEVNVSALKVCLDEMQPGLTSAKRSFKHWTAFKSVLKWEKIKKFQVILDQLKSTLSLHIQPDFL